MLQNGYNESTLKIVTTLLLLALASVVIIVQFSIGFQAFSYMQLHILFLVYLAFQIPMYVIFSFTETSYMRNMEVKVKHSIISFLVRQTFAKTIKLIKLQLVSRKRKGEDTTLIGQDLTTMAAQQVSQIMEVVNTLNKSYGNISSSDFENNIWKHTSFHQLN